MMKKIWRGEKNDLCKPVHELHELTRNHGGAFAEGLPLLTPGFFCLLKPGVCSERG